MFNRGWWRSPIAIRRSQFLLSMLVFFFMASNLHAQSDRATIFGTVTDSTGAAVPKVEVVATQITTGAQIKSVTNNLGYYSLSQLPIGQYELTFTKTGFATLHQTGIVLRTQQEVQVDTILKVGAITETVTVTTTPVLPMQTELGTNVGKRQLKDLPLSIVGDQGGRNILGLTEAITPNMGGGSWGLTIAGSQAHTTAVNIDGTSNDSGVIGDLAENQPSMDAVEEVQVTTAGLSAVDGRSGAGSVNLELKSGTEKFHGSAFGFLQNEALNANTWDNNWWLSQCAPSDESCKQNYRRAYNRYFDYGVAGGGPVWKQWLGLKKMYIFGAYEKFMTANYLRNSLGNTTPTLKMLQGDFSELLTAGANANPLGQCKTPNVPCPLLRWDGRPYTDSAGNTVYFGSIWSPRGTVYPGNVITDPLSPISTRIADLYRKYYAPTGPGVSNNFPSQVAWVPWQHQTQFSLKYDWWARDNDHIASSFLYILRPRDCLSNGCGTNQSLWQPGTTTGGPLTQGGQQITISDSYRISETHTFSPSLLNVIAFTFNSFTNKGRTLQELAGNTDWSGPAGFGSVQKYHFLPQIRFGNAVNGVGELGISGNYPPGYVAYNGVLNDILTWTTGRHVLKFGFEYRALGFNASSNGTALTYNFANNSFQPGDWYENTFTGFGFANFLLGQVSSASKQVPYSLYGRRKELAFFGEDDIRIGSRLTVHGSLRWELTRPLHVKDGHWSNWDPNAPNQAYGGIPGAYVWLKNPDDSFETYTDWHQLAPSLGISYKVTNKLVARGSGGITFVPLGWNGYSGIPYGSQVGFVGSDFINPIGTTPAFQWDGVTYGGVYTAPRGPDPANVGYQSTWGFPNVDPRTRQLGFTENWYIGLDYELPAHSVIEVSYLGNSGRNLHDGNLVPLNHPTWSTYRPHLFDGHLTDWICDAGTAAKDGYPYPYPGFCGQGWMAISPYPQTRANWSPVYFTNTPIGQSGYNAITIEGRKLTGALNLDLSYNWSRSTGNTGNAIYDVWGAGGYWYQDPYQYQREAQVPSTNQIIKGYLTYELPLGRGRRFLSASGRPVNILVSGWQVATNVWYGNGSQIWAVGASNTYPGWSALYTNVAPGASFKNHFKHWNPAWNPTVAGAGPDPGSLFVDPTIFSNPKLGEFGNSPRIFPNWRNWAQPSENASFLKNTRFGSDNRYTVTIRADFFNVFNRHYWNSPNLDFGTAYFGHVTGVSGNRVGQLGARFEW